MRTSANALVLMSKAPEPGCSKTRLVPPLSAEEAAAVAGALLRDQLENIGRFSTARLFVNFSAPSSPEEFVRSFVPPGFSSFAQRGNGLGERMRFAFERLLRRGFERVVLIGADLPPVPLEFLERAYALLERPAIDVVLGPSTDGGYYLVGMKREVPGIFEGIAWSRSDVLARTLERLETAGISWGLLPFWYDIDTAEDLRGLASLPDAGVMKNTSNLLHALKRKGRL
ncbi:MAG TPA: TIGR04282 family arsenosugar biosynthesis glycosyltransferase [candidate division Zixibacteria bacterium]|nr:TIGR04282 family arsenosugar biosynthesis glycosyltransferase [candidate division Zixibacteria bacterium]